MTNTRPVPNVNSPIVDKAGKLIAPWMQFFQQFVQKAPTIIDISALSPYQANQNGTIIITGGTGISITRGPDTIVLLDGQAIIPIAITDIVTFASGTVKFLGS
jgi:hypothetical protein